MSMPHSLRIPKHADLVLLLAALLGVSGLACAKQSDKNQPLHLDASHLLGSQQNGKLVVSGNVTLQQGSFKADGAKATGYSDPNDSSQWQRVVLTGAPAHFQQTQDSGALVHGQAQTIDYKVSANTVVLTGDATVVQEGRGTFHGEKLVYDTESGEIEGSANSGGRIHITLQPRSKPAPSSMPASSASTPSPPASAASSGNP